MPQMPQMLAFRPSGRQFRAWILATSRNTIALWSTLMGIFNLLTLFEKHSAFYHSLSATCLAISLVLRHHTIKGRPEAVRWLFFCFGLVQSFFFFMFWRHVKHGDVCPPVHFYLDPATNLYTVVPQLVMSDLPLIPHILFRLAHFAGSVSMYINVVGHPLKVAILRGLFIHGVVCSLGYLYTTRKLQGSYNAHLAAKQQQKAGVTHPWVEGEPSLRKPSKAGLLPPNEREESKDVPGKASQPAPPALERAAQGVVTDPTSACMHMLPDPVPAPGRWEVVPMQQLFSAEHSEARAAEATVPARFPKAGVTGAGDAQLCRGKMQGSELEAWVAATRARAYSSRLKRWKTTVKIHGNIEPESVPKDVCADVVTNMTTRFPGVLAVGAAIRHGCVVLSVECWAPKGESGEPQESQAEEDTDTERILDAATRWASWALPQDPEHGMELTVQVMEKLYRCHWDAPSHTWVLMADAASWKTTRERCSICVPCMAVSQEATTGKTLEKPAPSYAPLNLQHLQRMCSASSAGSSVFEAPTHPFVQGVMGGEAEASNVVHVGATVFCPAGKAQIQGWSGDKCHELDKAPGDGEEGVVEDGKSQQLQILARAPGEFLPVEVVRATQRGQEVQVTLALQLSDQLVGSFGRVSLELWHSLPGQKLLLQSLPLLVLPHSAHALATELNAWCQDTASKLHQGHEAIVEFVDDMAHWLHAQKRMMQVQQQLQQQQDQEDPLLMVELGRDLLEHCVKEGMVKGAETVLGLLLAGPYKLTFADIAYGGLSAGMGTAAVGSVKAEEREQLIQLAVLGGSVPMVERVLSWETKHAICLKLTSSTASCSSNCSFRWLEAGYTGVSPIQALHAVPSPAREEMQRLLMAEASWDAGRAGAQEVAGNIWSCPPSLMAPATSLPHTPKGTVASVATMQLEHHLSDGAVSVKTDMQGKGDLHHHHQQQQQQQEPTKERSCTPTSSGCTNTRCTLKSALRCLGGGGFVQCDDGVDEAAYRAWACQVSHATLCRWLPFAFYLLLVASMTCAALDTSMVESLSQPLRLGSVPANTLFSSVPATYMLLQFRSCGAQYGMTCKLCLMLSCVAFMLSGSLRTFAQPLLLQSLAISLSLTIGIIIDVTNRCYFLCCQQVLLPGGGEAKKVE